ncbi:LutC/YkgG family protein [Actinomadura flavalba]|uniref:LutC/YkgG family protein n=1 Tax=Actinomadura flavalba TaxID=1120938 RepID=UPI000370141C|nr:LUD domain-containing protein [Actinomadura flavalba]
MTGPDAPGGPDPATARDDILGRLGAPDDSVAEAYGAIRREYLRRHSEGDVRALFAERVAHYRAVVHTVTEARLPGALAAALRPGAYVLAPGLPAAWAAAIPPDRRAADGAELDAVAGVVTGCAAAIAETGTIVLDHGAGQGRRALTLVPDHHLVVVPADRIAADVPEALARLDVTRPLTFVSGPSATSDIELTRVEGVHGPRSLEVFVL